MLGAQLHGVRGAAHLGRCADLLGAGDRRGPRALGRGRPTRVSGPWPLGDGERGGWTRAGTVLHTCGELVGLRYWLVRVWVRV